MKLTPEKLAQLKAIKAYQRAGEIHATVEITDEAFRALIADLEDAQTELENERARGIHSCHDNCTRDGCVNRRLRDELATVRKQLAEARNREQLIRDNLAFERELHAKTETELSCLRKQLEEATAARGNGVLAPAQMLEEMHAELVATRKQLAEAQAFNAQVLSVAEKMRCAGGAQEFQHWFDELKLFLLRKPDISAIEAAVEAAVPHDLPSEQSYLDRGGCLRLGKPDGKLWEAN